MQTNDLFESAAFIDGNWIGAEDGEQFDVTNPANGEVIASLPNLGSADTEKAIDAASKALPAWRAKTAKERSAILRRWYELILENQDGLASLMTLEQGKPLAEANGEVMYGASFVEWFAEEAKRIYGDVIPSPFNDRRYVIVKQSIGVVAAITPWNFPIAMITRKCAPALAAGCSVVVKPSELTPLCALALAKLGAEAGFPAGVFNIITTTKAQEVGRVLTSSQTVRKLSFTGSTAVGKLLIRDCADTVKKVSMELGGNAPFIVFDDADLNAAVAGAMASKYRNAGQTCVCANRLFVHDTVYDAFAKKLAAVVSKLKVGDGFEEGSNQGPLINEDAVCKVERHIQDAVDKGAQVVCGGKRHQRGGTFFEPTVLTDVTPDMRVTREETFGPVAPLYRFSSEAEVIELANDTQSGLAAYFYSKDISRVWRVSEALEYGIVGVNEGVISTEVAPFGGVKESGLGREGSKYGIEEYLEIKYICMGGIEG
ncbi:NAD-dependent succinate-semialdehyde dehydrogenase [Solemya velum gill symbiont]|uniref:NAD-dependent succinate-semialdehyde dehydrogenase n=1 Tax=Solemya velum gill symbiont TaxID=2340 RepID=UPI000997DF0A|nr:NAD-dependent succinate-semialdehyde dehydrogenase [Solemya velum gill symbiont]OOY36852.1 succinate-semialdehyde dehydrogenase (NADP(+)) [Solemya velum gill symbiont]OOY40000.1 succinate-semialdehyde dehydrogenase (NADP(+)) [Solemya velum gill symbiont]OOY44803.1 succinate-semialdehyde dehydrogenase (NADP(+)) [Solemya velum gill symbiont]OOY46444.1 succinate-semialdehyde dehydrogenase (NADP(+)) [Solemya velum gill symbiont]OOY49647.1 succinate-semialdehyde dehydrogenase (NADP(+)) [Solemya 